MGLGAKLNIAFFTVILAMVATHAGYQIYMEYTSVRTNARKVLVPTLDKVISEIQRTQKHNFELAQKLNNENSFRNSFTAKSKDGVASAVRSFVEAEGLPGFVTVLDEKGRVFYSSDTPTRSGYEPEGQGKEINAVLQNNRPFQGIAALSAAGTLSVTSMVPISNGPVVTGIVAISQPINNEMLIGLQKKLEIADNLRGFSLALYSVRDGRIVAVTPDLSKQDGGYIAQVNREGKKAIKNGLEHGNRMWMVSDLLGIKDELIAEFIATTPVKDSTAKFALIAGQAGVSAVIALILGVMFSAGIAGRFNRSMNFLVQRAADLANQKSNLPALEDNLSGEMLELAEMIDTAVQSPRSSVKSMQTQMHRHQEQLEEKTKIIETQQSQVEAVNRQLMVQSRQLSEVSKQINHANQQAILVQQKLAAVLQISTEGFLLLDPFGNVLSANHVVLKWTGYNEAELAGRFIFDLVKRPGEPRNSGNDGSAFSRHGGHPGELISQFFPEGVLYHRQQDKALEVLAHLHPVTTDDNNIQGYIMVLRDKSIHSEVARLRSDILYMLQESIRAPLVAGEQKWSVLMANTQGLNSTLGSALHDLNGHYHQMRGVVDSLLMMYGGVVPTTPVVPREQVSITRLVGDCLEAVSQQARSHQIMLDYKTMTGLPTTGVSKDIIRDVIIALLEKTISVTAPGGRVRVESSARNNEIRVAIFSSGPALPATEIEDMFVGYVQGKHSEDSYSSRLSLYLVRNNIERIGGRVWAESDRGTYLYFTLPIVN